MGIHNARINDASCVYESNFDKIIASTKRTSFMQYEIIDAN